MTVSTTTTKNSLSANGTLHSFAYGFKIFANADISVIVRSATGTETVKTLDTHYVVTNAGNSSGGNVLFKFNTGTSSDAHFSSTDHRPANNETVVLARALTKTQGTDYVANDPFPAASHEDALDRLTMITQQIQEELDRTIKASVTNTLTGAEFTISATDRASKVFAFDSAGNLSVTQELGTARGNWAASTAYVERDIVVDSGTNSVFIVNAAHTSAGALPLTSNTNSAKYTVLVDASILGSVVSDATPQLGGVLASNGKDIAMADADKIIFGTNSDITISYDETTNDSLEIAAAVEGAALGIVLKADQGDDNADQWKVNIADGGVATINSKISGSFVSQMTLTPNATVASSTTSVAGNLTVGGSLTLGSGAVLAEAELEMIDGITAGTILASKAVVVDANKDVSSFRNLTASGAVTAGSLVIGSADIAEAELEMIDGITAGTALASKAMVLDSAKDISGGRNLTISGELDAATGDFSGIVDVAGALTVSNTTASSSSTTGSLIVGGGAGIADDLYVGDDLAVTGLATIGETLGVTGVVTANAGVVVDNITIDGQEIDVSSGDFLLDVAGDIHLDADGDNIKLFFSGAQYLDIYKSGDNIALFQPISDGDILFQGNDGGSVVAALSLDMSEAGTATFNHDIKLSDNGRIVFGAGADLAIYSDGTNGRIEAPNGDLVVDLAGDIILDVDGGDVIIKDGGVHVGTIGVQSTDQLYIGTPDGSGVGIVFDGDNRKIDPTNGAGSNLDNAVDLGNGSHRFKDLYLSGNVIIGTAGKGIDFSAADSGISGSGDNLLDEYEEGVHVTSFVCAGSGTITINSSFDTLFYTRIGRLVTINGRLKVSSVSSPVGAIILSLPFAALNIADTSCSVSLAPNTLASGSVTDFWGEVEQNGSRIVIYYGEGTSVAATAANKFAANTDLRVSVTYTAAA